MSKSHLHHLSEKEWMHRLRFDDEAALRCIFDTFFVSIANTAYLITADRAVSKDLAQDVFFEIWKRRHDLRIEISLEAYLRRAVRNRALNYLKANKKYLFDEEETLIQLEKSAENHRSDIATDASKQRLEALHLAIAELPEKCRQVFWLSRFEELSHREIAERLEISVKTIENQITKALRTLRERLAEHPEMSLIGIWWATFF